MNRTLRIVLALLGILLAAFCLYKANSGLDVYAVMPESGTFTDASQLANYLELGYFEADPGPISITPAVLSTEEGQREVSLVTIRGWESNLFFVCNDWGSCMKAGNNKDSSYLRRVRKVLTENIPEGSAVVLAGHSLGGMVAQQILADPDMQERYEFLYTVTFGSPVTMYGYEKEGEIRMLGDLGDSVIALSTDTRKHYNDTFYTIQKEDAGIDGSWESHMNSYIRQSVWGGYDVLGVEGGTASLTLDSSQRTFYSSKRWAK